MALAFSVSDDVTPTSLRLIQRLDKVYGDGEGEVDAPRGVGNAPIESGGKGKKAKRRKKQRRATEDSVESVGGTSGESSRPRGAGHLNKSVARRPRRTAVRSMTSLGGDFATKDAGEVKETRKLRGECEICGQACYEMTLFKAVPLNIPGMVREGRCLLCTAV